MAGLQKVLSAPPSVNHMAEAAGLAMADISIKKTGSISLDTKAKSLLQRWMTGKPNQQKGEDPEDDPVAKVIQHNVHVKVEISEGRGKSKKTTVENYCVLCIYTKTYNKWMPCDIRKSSFGQRV